jgi:hypothetical protein
MRLSREAFHGQGDAGASIESVDLLMQLLAIRCEPFDKHRRLLGAAFMTDGERLVALHLRFG